MDSFLSYRIFKNNKNADLEESNILTNKILI